MQTLARVPSAGAAAAELAEDTTEDAAEDADDATEDAPEDADDIAEETEDAVDDVEPPQADMLSATAAPANAVRTVFARTAMVCSFRGGLHGS